MKRTRLLPALFATAALLLSGCGGEGKAEASAPQRVTQLNIDFATYNPLSLVIKEKGWLEEALPGVKVNWVQSAGSNKANENLRAGAIDVGSTAGAAALLARANNSPIKAIDIYSQPEWTALVVGKNSSITDVKGLVGKKVAVTKGTDPYFFLLQSLDTFGVKHSDVTIVNLQHADGRVALENGSVDAWSGLDPIMATSEAQAGSKLIYRNVDFATYGFLNATESFLGKDPQTAQVVVDAYERARAWAKDNPDELAQILAKTAAIDVGIAKATLERTKLDVDPVPGAAQRAVLERVGPIFVASGDVRDQVSVDTALSGLFAPQFAQATTATAGK
ncbi:MAG: aliphatic sulfonate ABC transporter substrate-binding protein [Sporichthyaceae bacterium]